MKVGDSQGRGVAHELKMGILKCRAGGVMSSQGLSGKLKGGCLACCLPPLWRQVTFVAVWGRSLLKGWHIGSEAKEPRKQVSASLGVGG